MFISDQVWAMITCTKCGKKETHAANDKGSKFPDWGEFTPFDQFDIAVTGGGGREPTVTSATCRSCGTRASIETHHGLDKPEGY